MKRVNINGQNIQISDAEFLDRFPAVEATPEQTPEERIAGIEAEIAQLTAILEAIT